MTPSFSVRVLNLPSSLSPHFLQTSQATPDRDERSQRMDSRVSAGGCRELSRPPTETGAREGHCEPCQGETEAQQCCDRSRDCEASLQVPGHCSGSGAEEVSQGVFD